MTPVNASRKGSTFERATVAHLEDAGWPYVTRASNSKGIADVVAIGPQEVLFIECKTNGILLPAQWNQLYHGAIEAGGVPLMAAPIDRRRNRGADAIRYMRLLAPKTGKGHRQPWESYDIKWAGKAKEAATTVDDSVVAA